MPGLQDFTASRGYRKMKEYVGVPFIEAFSSSASWYFNTLFNEKAIEAPKNEQDGLKNIAAFLGILIPTAVAILAIPVALLYHSISGLIDAIRWTGKYSWTSDKQSFKSERNLLQETFAIPGYLISLPFCAAISLGRVLGYVVEPIFQGFVDGISLGFRALFDSKEKPESALLEKNESFLRKEHQGLRRIPAFIGHVAGFALAALASPVALAWHSSIGLVQTISWGTQRIWNTDYNEGFFVEVAQDRYPGQQALALPGYLLGLAACLPIGAVKILWGVAKPIGQGFIDALVKSLQALFSLKQAGQDFEPLKFRETHNTSQKFAAFIGFIPGIALAALISPAALAWHSSVGLIQTVGWGAQRIWSKGYNEPFSTEVAQDRYPGQQALALPGYLLGLAVCLPIGVAKVLWKMAKPIGQGFIDALTASLDALFSPKEINQDFEPLKFRKEHSTSQKFAAFIGFIPGIALAALISPAALAWHSSVGLIQTVGWGARRIWSKGYNQPFSTEVAQDRYPGQQALALPGYLLGLAVCLPIGAVKILWEAFKPLGEGFKDAVSLGFSALFKIKEASKDTLSNVDQPSLRSHEGLRRIPAFIGHVAGFALAALASPVALAWHSSVGLVQTVRWSAQRIWDKDYTESPNTLTQSRSLGQNILASPGYLFGLAICLPIGVAKVLWKMAKPIGQGFIDALTASLDALFSPKEINQDFEPLKFRKEHSTSQKFAAFIGFIPGIALAALISPTALAWHSSIGLIQTVGWGAQRIWSKGYNEPFSTEVAQDRYPGQQALALPGYLLGLAVCLPIGAVKILWEAFKPLGEGFKDAVSLGFSALFKIKEASKDTLSNVDQPSLRSHEGLRRIPAFIGHVAGFALAALASPVALAWHSSVGLVQTVGWGAQRIWDKDYTESPNTLTQSRSLGQNILASPGYLFGLAVCLPISTLKILWETVKPLGEGLMDALTLLGKMLFLDRVAADTTIKAEIDGLNNKPAIKAASPRVTYKPLGSLPSREEHAGLRRIPAFFGHLAALVLAVFLLPLAFAWHSISGLFETINWGIKRIGSPKNNKEDFSIVIAHRYPEQHVLASIGYVFGGLVCVVLAPFCLIYKYRGELKNGMKAGVAAFATMLPVLFVSTLKSFLLVAYNLFAFLSNVLTGNFRDAGLALERALVHFLGFISFGIFDAAYRSLTGRPPLIRTSIAVDSQDPEAQKEAESAMVLQKIYNALNYNGDLPQAENTSGIPNEAKASSDGDVDLSALDAAMAREGADKPSFSHTLARRVMKSSGAELGLDSPVEDALKEIAKQFKEEKEQESESKVAPTAGQDEAKGAFFARGRHHSIIRQNKDKYKAVRDKAGLDEKEIQALVKWDTELAKLANMDKAELNRIKGGIHPSSAKGMLDEAQLKQSGMPGLAALNSSILMKLVKLDKSELFKLTEVIQLEKLDLALTRSIDNEIHQKGIGG